MDYSFYFMGGGGGQLLSRQSTLRLLDVSIIRIVIVALFEYFFYINWPPRKRAKKDILNFLEKNSLKSA